MSFRVLVSRSAAHDIDRLEAWLLEKNPEAARRVGEVLEEAIASLVEFPDRGRWLGSDVRALNARLGHSTYVIRYLVRDDIIVVTRVFHGRERR